MAFNIFGLISSKQVGGRSIYAFGSHQYAMYIWTKAIEKGTITKDSTLVHIDFHTDFLPADRSLFIPITSQKVEELIKDQVICYDNFIKASIRTSIVKNVIFCCKPTIGEFNDCGSFKNYVSPINVVEILNRYKSNKALSEDNLFTCQRILGDKILLDIDLDFFVDFDSETIRLKQRALIQKEIEAINVLFQYSRITTICTSHDWSWNDQQRRTVQSVFSDGFVEEVKFDCEPPLIYPFRTSTCD